MHPKLMSPEAFVTRTGVPEPHLVCLASRLLSNSLSTWLSGFAQEAANWLTRPARTSSPDGRLTRSYSPGRAAQRPTAQPSPGGRRLAAQAAASPSSPARPSPLTQYPVSQYYSHFTR